MISKQLKEQPVGTFFVKDVACETQNAHVYRVIEKATKHNPLIICRSLVSGEVCQMSGKASVGRVDLDLRVCGIIQMGGEKGLPL